jgi:hypothetical protein
MELSITDKKKINTYNYLMRKLPPDLVTAIQEYANPETTWVLTKIQELQKQEPYLIYRTPDDKTMYQILQFMKIIPQIYTKIDKYLITQEEKHKIENFYNNYRFGKYVKGGYINHLNLSKVEMNYVNRHDLIVAFILCGFSYEYEVKDYEIKCKIKGKLDNRKFNKIDNRINKYIKEKYILDDPFYSSPAILKNKKYSNKINKIEAEGEEIKRLYFYN